MTAPRAMPTPPPRPGPPWCAVHLRCGTQERRPQRDGGEPQPRGALPGPAARHRGELSWLAVAGCTCVWELWPLLCVPACVPPPARWCTCSRGGWHAHCARALSASLHCSLAARDAVPASSFCLTQSAPGSRVFSPTHFLSLLFSKWRGEALSPPVPVQQGLPCGVTVTHTGASFPGLLPATYDVLPPLHAHMPAGPGGRQQLV